MKKAKREKMLKDRFNIKNKENVERINQRIRQEKNKKGLWRTKEQIKDINFRKYCERYNLENEKETL